MIFLPLTQPTLTPGIPQSHLVLFSELSLSMTVKHIYFLSQQYLSNIMNIKLTLVIIFFWPGQAFPSWGPHWSRTRQQPFAPQSLHTHGSSPGGVDTFSSFKNTFSPALEFLRTNPISVRWSLESPLRVRTAQQISAWSDISLLTYSVVFQYFEDETILKTQVSIMPTLWNSSALASSSMKSFSLRSFSRLTSSLT